MKHFKFLIFTLTLLYLAFLNFNPSYAKNVSIGVSFNDKGISDFYFYLGNYYHVPVEKIVIIKKRYPFILDEELPIIFLIHKNCKVKPEVIIKMRKRGFSWYSIMLHFGLYPEKIYKEYIIVNGPPYGKAWGYYKHHRKNKIILFTDKDIIELTNKKILKDYFKHKKIKF